MEDKKYLTVKEYAELKGCSTQYVYKLLQTKLATYVELVEGRKVLKIEALDATVATKVANQVANKPTKVANSKESNSDTDNEEIKRINQRNESIIDDLRAQLKEKDEQIKNQSEHIVELSSKIAELFENNQKLQLNYQLLLGNTVEQPYEEVNEEEYDEGARSNEEVKEEPIKKGLFSRLFK